MAAPADRFLALSPAQRRLVHERLVEHALAKWNAHAERQGEIRYRAERFSEPIAAMQDDDLSFPEPIAFAYYAIYNFFRRYAMHEEIDDWLLVNQACSSEEDEEKWQAVLVSAIERAV